MNSLGNQESSKKSPPNDEEVTTTLSTGFETAFLKQAEVMPLRVVIKFINTLSKDEVQGIDKSLNHFKVKIPLLLYAIGAGLLSSMVTSFIKGVSEMVNSRDIGENLQRPMVYLLLVMVVLSLVTQLHFMNMNLKYYEQMEIIPIYQSSIILTNVLCGAIIFQEMQKYNWW